MVVEARSEERCSLGYCSMPVGEVAIGALRGRNCLAGSDVDGEMMLRVPSCFEGGSDEN
jgi:hypothetical protein